MNDKKQAWYIVVWDFIKAKGWYIFLLILSTCYVMYYRFEIYELKEINARNLIFLLWLLLLALPLFSEMEFLGIKVKKQVKKEVEKATEEVKGTLQNIQTQLTQMQISSSVSNNVTFGNTALPSEQKLEELVTIVRELKEASSTRITINPSAPVIQTVNSDDSSIRDHNSNLYLVKVRYEIDISLRELCGKIGYNADMPISKMLQILNHEQVLAGRTCELINEVRKIANRGIHGEIISNEYITFVESAYPEIQHQLRAAIQNLKPITCPRCKFSGYSKLENVCPQCGYTYDD